MEKLEPWSPNVWQWFKFDKSAQKLRRLGMVQVDKL